MLLTIYADVADHIAHFHLFALSFERLRWLSILIEEKLQPQLYMYHKVLPIRTFAKALLCSNTSGLTVYLPFLISLLADNVCLFIETILLLCYLAGD
jgi:hypothetical protein